MKALTTLAALTISTTPALPAHASGPIGGMVHAAPAGNPSKRGPT
jgi:hypothetical protein